VAYLKPIDEQQRVRIDRQIAIANISHCRHGHKRKTHSDHTVAEEPVPKYVSKSPNTTINKSRGENSQRSPMQPLRPTIPKSQTPSRHNQRRDPKQMQPRLRLENTIVPLAVPVRVAVDEPATGPRAEHVADQAGDVDEADDGGSEVVGCNL